MSRNPIWLASGLAMIAGPSLAQNVADVQPNFAMNTLFIAICAILVMWMAAGFTMIEAGFVRSKNVVNQCAKNIGLFAIASICFLITGYGLMFPNGSWIVPGIIGSFGSVDLGTVADNNTDFGTKESASASGVFFQMMFCAAVASIVSGAVAERIRLIPFFIFTAIMTAIIYPIQASWAWGGGFLDTVFGFKDLAGSTVVHVVGGVAALTGSIILGARQGRFADGRRNAISSFSLPLATLGALILWMGWFGFNAGSYLSFSTDADAANVSRILLNTNLAAAGGVIGAGIVSYTRYERFDLTFMINGALAGLVSITAEPLFPSASLAVIIGMAGGLIVVWSVLLLDYLKVDDVVGAIPVHLFCGVWGTIAVVLSNPDATLVGQVTSVAIVIGFVGVTTAFIWLVLNATMGIRVSAENEELGMDQREMVLDV